jgi:hypothetical protein
MNYQMTIILPFVFCYDIINEYFDHNRNEGNANQ